MFLSFAISLIASINILLSFASLIVILTYPFPSRPFAFLKSAHNIRFLLDKATLGRNGSTRAVLDVWDTVHSDLYDVPSYFSSTHADQQIPALRMRTAKGIGRRMACIGKNVSPGKVILEGADVAK